MLNKRNCLAVATLYAVSLSSADQILTAAQKEDQETHSRSLQTNLETEDDDDVEFFKFRVKFDDVLTTLYLYAVGNDGEIEVSDNQKSLTVRGNSKIYLATEPSTARSALFTPELIGGFMGYTVDLSQVGCGCISSLYSVMPGDADLVGTFESCSVTKSDKAQCPEFNIFEANQYGFASSSHRCIVDDDGSYVDCDSVGSCTFNTSTDEPEKFGLGADFTVNSALPLRVRTDFVEGAANLWTGYRTSAKNPQKHRVSSYNKDCPYLRLSSDAAQKGMALAFKTGVSEYADQIQQGQCESECNPETTQTIFSDLYIKTTGAIESYNDYTRYQFGKICDEAQLASEDNECDDEFLECRWSWPPEETSDSRNAACRNLPKQRANQGYTFSQHQCQVPEDGQCDECDTSECAWSYPNDDPLGWESPEKQCRCRPETIDITFGHQCANNYSGECGADCSACHWSWPTNDTAGAASKEANCRCAVSDIKEYQFGDRCERRNQDECGNYCKECRLSWDSTDPKKFFSENATCRCYQWYG